MAPIQPAQRAPLTFSHPNPAGSTTSSLLPLNPLPFSPFRLPRIPSAPRLPQVYFNGEKIAVKGFQDYVGLFLGDKDPSQRIFERVNDMWEIAVATSEGQFQQMSFTNSIWTVKGGTHVNYIADQLAT